MVLRVYKINLDRAECPTGDCGSDSREKSCHHHHHHQADTPYTPMIALARVHPYINAGPGQTGVVLFAPLGEIRAGPSLGTAARPPAITGSPLRSTNLHVLALPAIPAIYYLPGRTGIPNNAIRSRPVGLKSSAKVKRMTANAVVRGT